MKIKATDGRLIIKELDDEQKSCIVLVNTDKQAKPWEIVDIGPNVTFPHGTKSKCAFAVGDKVWVDLSMAYEVTCAEGKFRVVEVPYVWAWEPKNA